jgi:hypothetical protein
MSRPTVRTVRKYRWLNKHGAPLEGVALMGEHGILAHLTYQEALATATDLADLIQEHRDKERQHG